MASIVDKVQKLKLDDGRKAPTGDKGPASGQAKAQLGNLSNEQRALFTKVSAEYPNLNHTLLLNLLRKSEFKEANFRPEIQMYMSLNKDANLPKDVREPEQEKTNEAPKPRPPRKNFEERPRGKPRDQNGPPFPPRERRRQSPDYVPKQHGARPAPDEAVNKKESQAETWTEHNPHAHNHNEKPAAEPAHKPAAQHEANAKTKIEPNTLPAKGLEIVMEVADKNIKKNLQILGDAEHEAEEKSEPEQHKGKGVTVTDSRYKKKIEVKRDWQEEPSEISKNERKPRIDIEPKKFESEEERLKSDRERQLEKVLKELKAQLSQQSSRMNDLEERIARLTEQVGEREGADGKHGGNTYCLVPMALVKDVLSSHTHRR